MSNSSSSSFFMCVEESAHLAAMKQLTPWERAVVEAMLEEKVERWSKTFYIFTDFSDPGGRSAMEYLEVDTKPDSENEDYSSYDTPEDPDKYTAFYERYSSLIPEASCITAETDF